MSARAERARNKPSDERALDAYSRAIVDVVEAVGPAVASLAVRRWRREGAGSGFVVAPDGVLLTNSHVVHGATHVQVRLRDGRELRGSVVGDDPATDLAVVKVHAQQLPYVEVGEARPVPGQLAIAIGNPLGFDATVSAGVVSATGRTLHQGRGRPIDDLVQHTAPLNPGSSGGPLAGGHGQLLGINTAVIHRSQGIGFAIPTATASWVLGQLLANGAVRRAVLGIAGMTRPLLGRLRALREGGSASAVEVQEVQRDGAAARAGVRPGDVLLAFDGAPIESITGLTRTLWRFEPGRPARLDVSRDGRALTVEIVPDRG
jgi:S1-C subfamily serine protease